VKTSKLIAAMLAAGVSMSAHAGFLLTENFDNVAGLGAKGWVQTSSGSAAGSGWFQGNTGVFSASSGGADSYAAANFVDTGGSISEWLLSPEVALASITLNFDLRLLGDGFLDTVEVWLSGNGASTNLADFSRVATYSASADTGWLTQSLALNNASPGRFAFRYFVANTATDGNYVGLDNLLVVPEPGSLALVSLALAGVVVLRRRPA
jgi:hypothetical protein